MTVARSTLIDEQRPGAYHLISRCVRRAFLCGDAAEHRRGWIEEGLRIQSQAFGIEVLTFAVMANHMHLVVRTDPQRARTWSAAEVVRRWGLLFPKRDPLTGEAGPWEPAEVERCAAIPGWAETRRQRLASVSWFMRILKQRIARRANAEDGVTGHFWEGRFHSIPLLGLGSVLSCMVYVDLNPIRAGMASSPEDSDYTGIQRRVQARQAQQQAQALVASAATTPKGPESTQDKETPELQQARLRAALGEEHGLWIAPCLRATGGHCDLDAYLQLVDHSGRILHHGKRGSIPAHLAPILTRLELDVDSWLGAMHSHGRFGGSAVGALVDLVSEAARRGLRWVVDKTGIHRDRRKPRQTATAPTPATG